MIAKSCERCGVQFDTGKSQKRFCSTKCKHTAVNIRRKAERMDAIPERACIVCKKVWKPSRSNTTICSDACWAIHRRAFDAARIAEGRKSRARPAQCCVCGVPYIATRKTQVYCGRACYDANRSRIVTDYIKHTAGGYRKKCRRCEAEFAPGLNRQTLYCSDECRGKKEIQERDCSECGKQFKTFLTHKMTCGTECHQARKAKKETEYRRELISKTCSNCGKEFMSSRGKPHRAIHIVCGLCIASMPRGDRWRYRRPIIDASKEVRIASVRMPCESCVHGMRSDASDTGWMCRANAFVCKPTVANRLYQEIVNAR